MKQSEAWTFSLTKSDVEDNPDLHHEWLVMQCNADYQRFWSWNWSYDEERSPLISEEIRRNNPPVNMRILIDLSYMRVKEEF